MNEKESQGEGRTGEKIRNNLELLEGEVSPSEAMSSGALRERAKAIASVGLENFTGELLSRCFAISVAIVDFANELDEPERST